MSHRQHRAGALYAGSLGYLEQLAAARPESLAEYLADPAHAPARPPADAAMPTRAGAAQVGVLQLINAYRFHGFRIADLDPLQLHEPPQLAELDPAHHGLTAADLDQTYEAGSLAGTARDTLRGILARLQAAYCGTLSPEYMHIADTRRKRWLQARIEPSGEAAADPDTQRWLLAQLTAAETLERTLHTRYVGQKRFSLEGAESLIPLLNGLIGEAARAGVQAIGLGMAHRGRLNVLHNVLGRSVIELFEQTHPKTPGAGAADPPAAAGAQDAAAQRSGDVKYHQGFSADLATPHGAVRVVLAFNPSHLEIVNPVVEGWVRAQQQRREDPQRQRVMPVLIHGDAAFAGQGVVMETLNMAATRGFRTGGTIHVVVNNQIGFTTSDPRDTRSSLYCTDVMKMVDAPVLHVNGDDPEAVLRAVRLAVAYRAAWQQDIAIDLLCYRRLGHNEQDDPLVTQPLMYRRIHALPSTRARYAARLIEAGVITAHAAEALIQRYRASLETSDGAPAAARTASDWAPYRHTHWRAPARTAIPRQRLQALARRLTEVPAGFSLHPRVEKIIQDRWAMANDQLPLDWGMAETLAYASLLSDGIAVRLSGQDSGRGTFFHRHAVLHDQRRERWDDGVYVPLQHLVPGQADFQVIDSLLSEAAVLGFEYGYSGASPEHLVIWEAQFGDFANGAQVVIDQFIAAAETKWGLLNGLVLFLPHGYEGQGPEHSSGRIERFLQLAAHDNFQLAQPTTPAQIFHLLRRQMVRPYRKPLVVFTPKSLLRHADTVSSLDELAHGEFSPVLDDPRALPRARVERLVFCTGRIYYDLMRASRERDERAPEQAGRLAIIRIEQLYPLPDVELKEVLSRYPGVRGITWAQDEPQNQGAWRFIAYQIRMASGFWLDYAGRPESAAPATGIASLHKQQLDAILAAALQVG